MHHTLESGIEGYRASNFEIIGCTVTQTCLYFPRSNFNALDHPAALTTSWCHDFVIKGCVVYENWGEGIGPFVSRNLVVEDCISYDNMSVGIYLANTYNAIIRRNLVYESPESTIKKRSGLNMHGIGICDESHYKNDSTLGHDRTIINNIVMGCSSGFFYWFNYKGSSLKNDIIANNTFVDSEKFAGQKDGWGLEIGPAVAHENSRIENNIIIQGDAGKIFEGYSHRDGLTFSNNCWSRPITDVKDAVKEAASSSGDYVGDPMISREGTFAAGKLTADYFRPLKDSPIIDKGVDNLSIVDEDFFGNKRTGLPDMGAIEYIEE